MALEAVVFPPDPYPFTYGCKDMYSLVPAWNYHEDDDYGFQAEQQEKALSGLINHNNIVIEQSHSITHANENATTNWDSHSNSSAADKSLPPPSGGGRRKRRRTRSTKNKEEIENQRMTHIAVERNRRKQMNDYLAVLRSLMPPSYVQRGDQASIIGGAINFVKELEQLVQCMEEGKKSKQQDMGSSSSSSSSAFAEFFTFPQYTRHSNKGSNQQNAAADIEVTMVDTHANLKIMAKKREGQLMKMVVGLQNLRLTILHLNVTTLDHNVLYSVSVKVEEGCELNSADEIAAAVNELLRTIQDDAAFT